MHSTPFFVIKIPSKEELQQIALNDLSDIKFNDFIKLWKGYAKKIFSFLVNNTSLPSGNTLIDC